MGFGTVCEAHLSFGKRDVTNTPQVKLHRIIVKLIFHFVSQMILYLGPLLQCVHFQYSTVREEKKRIITEMF
jgi:hypothetical protein